MPASRRIAATLARAAYRRPVTEQDVDPLMPFFDEGRKQGFDAGIEQMIAAILVSPDFLYRAVKDAREADRISNSPRACPSSSGARDRTRRC